MPRFTLAAGCAAALALIAGASPAFAGYGAFAFDQAAHRFGYSHDQATQRQADADALKGCNSPGCKIEFRTGPRQCGAFATGEHGKVWGGSWRKQLDAARLAALQDCQKRTHGQCKVQASACNH